MTVPPNQPQRPSDEIQPRNESAPANATPPNTPPGSDTSPTLDQTIATDQALAGLPQQHTDPTPTAAPAVPPATTYLSGILTAGLAAICGAVFTSWTGVQGTLVGAMIGATIGSSVSEVVRAPLDTLERRLIAAGFSARRLRRDGVVKTVATSPAAAQQAFSLVSRGAIVTVGATAIVGFLARQAPANASTNQGERSSRA